MRILAISDIHNNVACVRKLRAQEANEYDVIAIAGDIGTHRAAEIFETLQTFDCPIVYVHGNWDRMPEETAFGPRSHLVHLKVERIEGLAFVGYSFSGPLPSDVGDAKGHADYTKKCRELVRAAITKADVDIRRCVLLAHDRATRLDREFPDLLLHLYGHIHRFDVRQRGRTTYVNTSALDRILPVARKHDLTKTLYVNAGNYAVIEIGGNSRITVECRLLRRNYAGWEVLGRHVAINRGTGGELIPEDAVYGDNVRFPPLTRKRR